MFTGIIAETGRLLRRTPASIFIEKRWPDVQTGESISINGVCLTVTAQDAVRIRFDVSPQTLKKTTLGNISEGRLLNLERSLKLGDRLGGHFVYGHVDGAARVLRRWKRGEFVYFVI
ncbi:MAG TPA: riboflavin synthase, partial [bacterium]|nr:riboflavin synthase [bacterium]